jgi:large subunit ribosomal protein L17
MDGSARKAMLRNMVTSLMLHGQIRTTEHRAKELRKYADRVISLGKRAPRPSAFTSLEGDALQQARADRVHAIRRAALWIHDQEALRRVFEEYAERYADRPGGYTRVVKAGLRPGDNAPMAIIQLVEAMGEGVPVADDAEVPAVAAGTEE